MSDTMLILVILGNREMYGLDIVKESNGSLFRGVIYVTLEKMEDMGLITSRTDSTVLKRRLYKATEAGRAYTVASFPLAREAAQ